MCHSENTILPCLNNHKQNPKISVNDRTYARYASQAVIVVMTRTFMLRPAMTSALLHTRLRCAIGISNRKKQKNMYRLRSKQKKGNPISSRLFSSNICRHLIDPGMGSCVAEPPCTPFPDTPMAAGIALHSLRRTPYPPLCLSKCSAARA